MKKNLKLSKLIKKNLIYIVLIIIICINFKFFENTFKVIRYEKNQRLFNFSNFCEKDSQGFVIYLTENYKFQTNPTLVNNHISPLSDWVYFDFNKIKNNSQKEIILLNYDEFELLDLKKTNSYFILNSVPPLFKKLEYLSIKFNKNFDLPQYVEIKIFKLENNKKIKIYKKKFKVNRKENFHKFYLSLDDDGSKIRKYLFDIKADKENMIDSVKINIRNKIDLDSYKIVEKKKNCYFLKDD